MGGRRQSTCRGGRHAASCDGAAPLIGFILSLLAAVGLSISFLLVVFVVVVVAL